MPKENNLTSVYPTYAPQPFYPNPTDYPRYPHHPPFPIAPNTPFPVRPVVAYPPHVPPYTTFGTTSQYNKDRATGMPPTYNEMTGECSFHITHPPMSTYRPPSPSAYWGPINQPINLGAIYDAGACFNNKTRPSIPVDTSLSKPTKQEQTILSQDRVVMCPVNKGVWYREDGGIGGYRWW